MIEKEFIQRGITKAKLEEFLESELRNANYSHIDVTKTPTSTNIVIWSEKPGLVIGRGGSRINEIIDAFENQFGIENPQVDAQEVEEPDLDANVVAKNVAGWLEKGGHPKRVGNTYMRRVMDAGAVGVEIEISGKLSGSRGRNEKFIDGYVKKCGDTAKDYVDVAFEKAVTKPGALGVKVRIMKDIPAHMKLTFEEDEPTAEEIAEEAEQDAEESDEDETAEEPADVNYDNLVTGTVDEVKDAVRDGDLDVAAVLAAEEAGKDRSTLTGWLENRVPEDAGETAADESSEDADGSGDDADASDDIDYDDVVSGTIAEIKEAIEEQELDVAKVLAAEQENKDRVTLVDWLEGRLED